MQFLKSKGTTNTLNYFFRPIEKYFLSIRDLERKNNLLNVWFGLKGIHAHSLSQTHRRLRNLIAVS